MSDTEMECEVDAVLSSREEVLDASESPSANLKVAVAWLSNQDILEMKPLELVHVIKVADAFASRGWFQQLQFVEHDELKRLAYLARRTCRHQINAAYEHRGWQVPFMEVL